MPDSDIEHGAGSKGLVQAKLYLPEFFRFRVWIWHTEGGADVIDAGYAKAFSVPRPEL